MSAFFGFLIVVLFFTMIVGMIKPKLIIKHEGVKFKRLLIFFGWIFLTIILAVVSPEPSTEEESKEIVDKGYKSPQDSIRSVTSGCKVYIRHYLEQTMNDADSYEDVNWSKPTKTEFGYSIRHTFRGNNAFGAKVINTKTFYLDEKFHVIKVQ